MASMMIHRKSRGFAPDGFFECEAKGLQWLAEASGKGGPRVVTVDSWGR
ncbi:MAG: fructosamine kinase, partial [Scardovia wiggsiae]|nr:fructosamine kinase [Scardovia wiggsiae]